MMGCGGPAILETEAVSNASSSPCAHFDRLEMHGRNNAQTQIAEAAPARRDLYGYLNRMRDEAQPFSGALGLGFTSVPRNSDGHIALAGGATHLHDHRRIARG